MLLTCLALGACRHGPAACAKPGIYEQAQSIAPLRIPTGLEAPDTRGALRVPDLNEPAVARPAGSPCLDQPPRYSPNARLTAPESGKKSKRAKRGETPPSPPVAPPLQSAPAPAPTP
jgi:hypothetical protein